VTFTETGHAYKVESDGMIQFTKPIPKISSYKIVNLSGTEITEEGQVESGELYIIITPTIENGTIQSLTCNQENTVELQSNGTYKVTVIKNGEYTFTIVGNVNGETITTEAEKIELKSFKIKTAFNTLLITGNKTLENQATSPYVQYIDKNGNPIICKVLYDANDEDSNNNKYGIQIVSINSLATVGLGTVDTNYSSETNSFEKAKKSYNNAVANLNKYAIDNYLNTNLSPTNGARCIGSNPIIPNSEGGLFVLPDNVQNSYNDTAKGKINENFKNADRNYIEDETRLKAISSFIITNSSYYWFASRYIYSDSSETRFLMINVGSNGIHSGEILCRIFSGGSVYADDGKERGFRPVFTLSPNVKIAGGTGIDEEHPYILSVEKAI